MGSLTFGHPLLPFIRIPHKFISDYVTARWSWYKSSERQCSKSLLTKSTIWQNFGLKKFPQMTPFVDKDLEKSALWTLSYVISYSVISDSSFYILCFINFLFLVISDSIISDSVTSMSTFWLHCLSDIVTITL